MWQWLYLPWYSSKKKIFEHKSHRILISNNYRASCRREFKIPTWTFKTPLFQCRIWSIPWRRRRRKRAKYFSMNRISLSSSRFWKDWGIEWAKSRSACSIAIKIFGSRSCIRRSRLWRPSQWYSRSWMNTSILKSALRWVFRFATKTSSARKLRIISLK